MAKGGDKFFHNFKRGGTSSSSKQVIPNIRKILKRRSFSIVLLFLLDFISKTNCQNCAVPDIVKIEQDGSMKETLDTGQTLKTIKVLNVLDVVNIQQDPPEFTLAKFNPFLSVITLEVDKPLWRNGSKSFTDKERVDCILVVVTLSCTDHQTKDVTFEIPILDENTELPYFEETKNFTNNEYIFEIEPCFAKRCPLVFPCDISVIDEDRDELNAKMEIVTNSKNVELIYIEQLSELDPWYDKEEYFQKRVGYKRKVRLELIWSEILNTEKDFKFDVLVRNEKVHADGETYWVKAKVTLRFREKENRVLPPIFSSNVYFMYMKDYPSSNSFHIYPTEISAGVPWTDKAVKIHYSLVGGRSSILQMNSTSADLEACDTFSYDEYKQLKSSVLEYQIIAKRSKKFRSSDSLHQTVEISSSATLIVLFPDCKDYTAINPVDPPECHSYDAVSPCPVYPKKPSTTTSVAPKSVATSIPAEEFEETSPSTPTESTLTSALTTTQPTHQPPPTRPPGHCTCDCTQFSCRSSFKDPKALIGYSVHVDPYYCMKYHECTKKEDNISGGDDGVSFDQSTFICPSETVFCPNMSKCLTVNECLAQSKSYLSSTAPFPTAHDFGFLQDTYDWQCGNVSCTCSKDIYPGEPGNHCYMENYQDIIEDPDYCDVFHTCQPMFDLPTNYFIDYPHRCAKGLVYCPALKQCSYPTDSRCKCNKTFKYCDVYEMGLWKGFDIFQKKFKND